MENNCELMIELKTTDQYNKLTGQSKGKWLDLEVFYPIIGSSFPFSKKHGLKLIDCIEDGDQRFVKIEVGINDEFDAEKLSLFLAELEDVKNHWMVMYNFEGWGWMIGGDNNNRTFDYFDDVESGEEEYSDWAVNLPNGNALGVFSEGFFD